MRENELVDLLIENGYKISSAESCTGGMFAEHIVNVPNASKVLDMSFVTYSNESKIELLGVSVKTIEAVGVVSEEVAKEMAEGVMKKAGANVGVGITGIAGPTGATKTKPVGMVCFGICINGVTKTFTKIFSGDRTSVREQSTDFVINTLISLLKKIKRFKEGKTCITN